MSKLRRLLYFVALALLVGCSGDQGDSLQDPVPDPIDWVIVVSTDLDNTVYWPTTPDADSYIVEWGTSTIAVAQGLSAVSVDPVGAPLWRHPVSDPDQPLYYRVYGVNGPRNGPPSIIAKSTVLAARNVDISRAYTPALLDINGDGCLDAVAAFGDCAGGFISLAPTDVGIDALFAPGRSNRDTRLADFNGDGLVDMFTNVYSRADNPDSYAILHFNDGDHTFSEDPQIRSMAIGGFGETVLVADFNNDGALDIFVPHYTSRDDGGKNWLLINDGFGGFTDVASSAGVELNSYGNPEAAQALDYDQDGWIDIFVASQLFRNNGDLTFTDIGGQIALPTLFDEGAKFSDVDLDGDLDFILHDSSVTRVYMNIDGTFDQGLTFNAPPESYGYGLNVCDLNADGYQDVVVAYNSRATSSGYTRLFLNANGEFMESRLWIETEAYNGPVACADLNNDGALDILARQRDGYKAYLSQDVEERIITVRVLGAAGELNQQGRLIRVVPLAESGKQLLQFVEAGSGYMAQGGYDSIFGTPWPGTYEVSVRFAQGWTTATALPGDTVVIRENGDVSILSSGR